MLKIKCDINQQYLKTVDLHFVKSEYFSLTWSCGSRQRDTTSSGWKRLNNLAVKGLMLECGHVSCLTARYTVYPSRCHVNHASRGARGGLSGLGLAADLPPQIGRSKIDLIVTNYRTGSNFSAFLRIFENIPFTISQIISFLHRDKCR